MTLADPGIIEWWAGLTRGFRFSIALLLIGTGAGIYYLQLGLFWPLTLLSAGVVLFLTAIELRNEA